MNSATKVLKCLINIRKDTLKIVKQEDAKYNIEFKFDCDIDVKIEIYCFVREKFVNGKLNYTTIIADSPHFKSNVYKAGSNIQFRQSDYFINPSKYDVSNVCYLFTRKL